MAVNPRKKYYGKKEVSNKNKSILITLVIFLMSCNDKPRKQNNKTLEDERSSNKLTDKEDWIRKVKILNQMNEGDTLITTDSIFTKSKRRTR